MYDSREACAELARTFHGLRNAPGIQIGESVDLSVFDEWASKQEPRDGVREAAQFVLHLFNRDRDWRCGRFDFLTSIMCWDEDHRTAFRQGYGSLSDRRRYA